MDLRWLITFKKEKVFLTKFTQGLKPRSVKCLRRRNNPRKRWMSTNRICRLEKIWSRRLKNASRVERWRSMRTPQPRRTSRIQSTTKSLKRSRKSSSQKSFKSKQKNQLTLLISYLSISKNSKKESPRKSNFNAEKNAKASWMNTSARDCLANRATLFIARLLAQAALPSPSSELDTNARLEKIITCAEDVKMNCNHSLIRWSRLENQSKSRKKSQLLRLKKTNQFRLSSIQRLVRGENLLRTKHPLRVILLVHASLTSSVTNWQS